MRKLNRKTVSRRKIRSNILFPKVGGTVADESVMFGTPASASAPMTPEAIAEMEKSYEDFLALRKKRVLENVGRDEPFTRNE